MLCINRLKSTALQVRTTSELGVARFRGAGLTFPTDTSFLQLFDFLVIFHPLGNDPYCAGQFRFFGQGIVALG